jgi:hypothetical protein
LIRVNTSMHEREEKVVGMLVLKYLLQQKMLGRTEVNESEIHHALGYTWSDIYEDRIFTLTDLGEDAVSINDYLN